MPYRSLLIIFIIRIAPNKMFLSKKTEFPGYIAFANFVKQLHILRRQVLRRESLTTNLRTHDWKILQNKHFFVHVSCVVKKYLPQQKACHIKVLRLSI